MAEPFFYSEQLADPGATLTLSGDEAHHATAVRRLRAGDVLCLFDGRGGLARATLTGITARGRALDLRIDERHTAPPPKPAIHLVCALPKGDRQGTLLDMTTQLGLTTFTPLVCERSAVQPGANSVERWRRICLEACKQSRRLYLPVVHSPATLQKIMAQKPAQAGAVWIAHPAADAMPVVDAVAQNALHDVTILIGPEGGFTENEIAQALAAGARSLSLGSAILRIETAAVSLVAFFALANGS